MYQVNNRSENFKNKIKKNKKLKKIWKLNEVLKKLPDKNITLSPKINGVGIVLKKDGSVLLRRSKKNITHLVLHLQKKLNNFLKYAPLNGELMLSGMIYWKRTDLVGLINKKRYCNKHNNLTIYFYKFYEDYNYKKKDIQKYVKRFENLENVDGIIFQRSIVYKFPGPKSCATVKEIVKTVGKTGKINYKAILKNSIYLNETCVKRVNLANNKNNVKVGDSIIVELMAVPRLVKVEKKIGDYKKWNKNNNKRKNIICDNLCLQN